jgi:hypothetical protein
MRISKPILLKISGAVWLGVGMMLLNLGAHFLMEIGPTGNEWPILGLIILSVMIGQVKGRTVLAKVAARSSARLEAISHKTTLMDLYTKKDLIVVGLMMLLGMSMKSFSLPAAVRGFIDVAVGTGLIQGALCYFRHSVTMKIKG